MIEMLYDITDIGGKMFATVSARVPIEVRNQVHKKLSKNGSTPSKFINDVYKSYLDGDLEIAKENVHISDSEAKSEVLEKLNRSCCNFNNPLPASFDFEKTLVSGRVADYETLA